MKVLLGVDSGGSHTRAICVDGTGRYLGGAMSGGGSPSDNSDARDNVRNAIGAALASAGATVADVIALGAGLADLDEESDQVWAEDFVAVDGLDCPRFVVNDAVVAHIGAFTGGPGVMVVAGTGSMILAVTDSGEQITNDQYEHFAGGARHLAFDTMARILIDDDTDKDERFLGEILEYWNAPDKPGLRRNLAEMRSMDRNAVKRRYGGMAPLITAAVGHSPLAAEACRRLVRATGVGVRLVAADIASEPVRVALEGGVARSSAFRDLLRAELAATAGRMGLAPAVLTPAAGAVLMAMQRAGLDPDGAVIERLAASVRPLAPVPSR